MDIRTLRQPPTLPEEYFEVQRALVAEIDDLLLLRRPQNLATIHALLAFEIMAHTLRPSAEREIHARRQLGLPFAVTMFTSVMHGSHRGLTILLRSIAKAKVRDQLPTEPNADIQAEAVDALRRVNGLIEDFVALDDVLLGWRDCIVEGKVLRIPSRNPDRFARSIELGAHAEADENAAYLAASADAQDETALHLYLRQLALVLPSGFLYEPDDVALDLATVGTRRAGEYLSGWTLPRDLSIQDAFTVGEYRSTAETVKAFAGALQIFDDYREPRGGPRLPTKLLREWTDLLALRTGMDRARTAAILRFLTHAASDLYAGGTASPLAAHTPFFDLGGGRLALAPTLAIWQEPQLALRTIWKARASGDYNTKVTALNHRLSEETGDLFAAKGWPRVVRRRITEAGDIDAGTGAEDFFIAGECKVFIDDPVRGGDDPAVWRELDRNVSALEDEAVARRVLTQERLAPREIVGLVVVPGRAQSPVDFGPRYALLGADDLRDRVSEVATPRDLWASIKAHETRRTADVVVVRRQIGDWTLEADGVRRDALLSS
jgi:hypothetical protein